VVCGLGILGDHRYGVGIWSGLRASLPGSAPYLEGIVPAIAIVVGSWLFRSITHELDQRAREADRMAHFHKALALCSHYLHEYREDVPEDALNALLAATKASSVFASRNVDDPELGLCTSMLAEVLADGVPEDPPGTWDLVPWTDVPYARDRLANGQTVYYQLSETSPAEQELYRDTGVTSECNIPIMIDGKWHGFLGISYVDGLQAEESDFELLETAARIFGAYWKVKEQRVELEYLVRSKDELITAVSHELRTPLTGILGFAEALVETAPSEQMEFIELIADQGRDMADIIETTKIQALAAGHNMVTEGDPTLALGDPVRIRQIVRNLVSNALNHGGLETRIEVSSSNGRSEVAVWDDGNSLSTEATGQLFDRFYTGQQPRSQPGSVGLGLFVSRRLARLMGGDLTVEVDDVGTTFRLSLPHPTPTLEAAQDND
jgi:signal transduction histidine kinase